MVARSMTRSIVRSVRVRRIHKGILSTSPYARLALGRDSGLFVYRHRSTGSVRSSRLGDGHGLGMRPPLALGALIAAAEEQQGGEAQAENRG